MAVLRPATEHTAVAFAYSEEGEHITGYGSVCLLTVHQRVTHSESLV